MKTKLISFLLACLIYSVTIVNAPLAIIYIVISFIGFCFALQDFRNKNILKTDVFLLVFLLLSIIVYIVGNGLRENTFGKSANDFIPYTIFITTTIFFSRHLNKKIFKIILLFIIGEVLIGVGEYLLGFPYIIKPLTAQASQGFGSTDILYNNKVYGISAVTSVFAQKIFSGFLLLHFLNIKKYKNIIIGLLCCGLVITFNRTAIVSTLVFGLILYYPKLKKINFKQFLLSTVIVITAGIVFYRNSNTILFQFFAGEGEMDLSGRDMIFPAFLNFIENNLLFGNFVDKVWKELSPGRFYHAHNSFLETMASLGIILSVLFFIYLYKIIPKKSLLYIIPIFVYSMFQYGIFWGVSYLDIVFFSFIYYFHNQNVFQRKATHNHKNKTIIHKISTR